MQRTCTGARSCVLSHDSTAILMLRDRGGRTSLANTSFRSAKSNSVGLNCRGEGTFSVKGRPLDVTRVVLVRAMLQVTAVCSYAPGTHLHAVEGEHVDVLWKVLALLRTNARLGPRAGHPAAEATVAAQTKRHTHTHIHTHARTHAYVRSPFSVHVPAAAPLQVGPLDAPCAQERLSCIAKHLRALLDAIGGAHDVHEGLVRLSTQQHSHTATTDDVRQQPNGLMQARV
jgi:hypothetical protein